MLRRPSPPYHSDLLIGQVEDGVLCSAWRVCVRSWMGVIYGLTVSRPGTNGVRHAATHRGGWVIIVIVIVMGQGVVGEERLFCVCIGLETWAQLRPALSPYPCC